MIGPFDGDDRSDCTCDEGWGPRQCADGESIETWLDGHVCSGGRRW